jgi:hypothetical protein
MESSPQIQIPNPQQFIINSQDFQKAPAPDFPIKNVIIICIGLLLISGVGYGVYSFKKATDSYQKAIEKQSNQLSELMDEANEPASLSLVGKVQASYENPVEEETSYENPFEEYHNPFNE